jgi:hypothetical protein
MGYVSQLPSGNPSNCQIRAALLFQTWQLQPHQDRNTTNTKPFEKDQHHNVVRRTTRKR